MDKERCAWVADDPLAIQYHDEEFGEAIENDDDLFERLSLEIFQAGLNWRLILKKRAAIRRAFAGFAIDTVAAFDESHILRLLKEKDIIKNRRKILATIENAKRVQGLISEYGSFAAFIGELRGNQDEMYRELRKRFVFVGPTVAESFLQSIGKIEPMHEPDCWKYGLSGRRKIIGDSRD